MSKSITLLLSNPSRFDIKSDKLLSGYLNTVVETILFPLRLKDINVVTLDDIEHKLNRIPGETLVVLACGDACIKLLPAPYNKYKLDEIRGYTIPTNEFTIIPTYFPQDILDMKDYEATHNPMKQKLSYRITQVQDEELDTKSHGKTNRNNYRFWFTQDINKAKRLIRKQPEVNSCKLHINPQLSLLLNWMDNIHNETVYFDIETIPETGQITCFALSTGPAEVYAIPIIDHHFEHIYSPQGTARILRSLARVFKDNIIVAHNAMFDLLTMLYVYKIPPPPQKQIHCTMQMHHRLYPEVEKSLGHCVSLYTDQPFHKNDADSYIPRTYQQWINLLTYNGKDVETLALVHKELLRRGKMQNVLDSMTQANESIRPYLLLSFRGLKLDVDKLCSRIDECKEHANLLETKVLSKLVGYNINPRSPQQVAHYLFDQLKIKRPTKEPTNTKSLFNIMAAHYIPAIDVIIKARRLNKIASDLSFKLWRNDRLTCAWKIHGTDTFRLSSSALNRTSKKEYKDNEYGRNAQNWAKAQRILVIPDRGTKFVQVDQAGAEALIVAYLARYGKLRQLIENNIKPHIYVALHLFSEHWQSLLGISASELKLYLNSAIPDLKGRKYWPQLAEAIKLSDEDIPAKRYYFMAKMTCHASNYSVGVYEFIQNILDKSDGEVRISFHEGKRFRGIYDTLFKEVVEWQADIQETVKHTKILRNLFGYPRRFTSNVVRQTSKAAYAFIPQSTVGCITSIAFSEIQEKLDSGEYENFSIMQNNHDSLLAQCKEEYALYTARIICKHFNRELISPRGDKFFMKSEASVGNNWKEMTEIKL